MHLTLKFLRRIRYKHVSFVVDAQIWGTEGLAWFGLMTRNSTKDDSGMEGKHWRSKNGVWSGNHERSQGTNLGGQSLT